MKKFYVVEVFDITHNGDCIGVFDTIAGAQSAIFEIEADYNRKNLNPSFKTLDTGEYYIRFPEDEDNTEVEYFIIGVPLNQISWDA